MAERHGPARDLAAIALVALALVLPSRPEALAVLPRFPLELPALVLLLALARGRWRATLRLAAVAGLALLPLLKLADLGTHIAYGRPFNLVLDLHLLPASWRLASGAIGVPATLAAALALLLAAALLALALWWAAGRLAGRAASLRASLRAGLAAAALAAVLLVAADASQRFDPPGAATSTRLAAAHLERALATRDDLARLQAAAARDAYADLPPEAILPALRGHDVLVIFVESYGRAAIEAPLYALTTCPTLARAEARLGAAGYAMRSGWLTAPMVGGQSWLAHASLLSGLGIDNQQRYQALIASPRRTLLHLASRAGWRTVAVMPAITLAWPEGAYFGYDRILASADLGYAGAPFNWVTMPDQFTLAAVERLVLEPAPRPPVMAEIALISSHAPWTPIPPLLPWGTLGDGRVFDRYATAGDPPDVVWRDQDRIRDQYRQAIDYALRSATEFAGRRAERAPLIVLLGDHQPASFVSQDPVGRDVPVHVIGPPDLVARMDGFGWTAGLLPDPAVPAWPMSAFRDRFLDAFGAAGPSAADEAASAAPLPSTPAPDPVIQ